MSDTANPASLASAEEFDARLKRTDEDRWLAARYAPKPARERLVAVYLLHQELQRALHAKEAMLGKIRIQWWREAIGEIAGKAPVRRHDLAQELARVASDLAAPMNDLIDCFDDVIDDHLHGGHVEGGDHEKHHLATEAALMRLAGLALDPKATSEQFAALSTCGEARLAIAAKLPDAAARQAAARSAARALPPQLWPAILHLVAEGDKPASPLGKRWRMFGAMLIRRL